jgi:hypothetical protein
MKDSSFGQLEFQNHISEFLVTYTDDPDKRMVYFDGIREEKGEHSLGQ